MDCAAKCWGTKRLTAVGAQLYTVHGSQRESAGRAFVLPSVPLSRPATEPFCSKQTIHFSNLLTVGGNIFLHSKHLTISAFS